MLWCAIAYRKRKNDHTLPIQTRYHVPLEMMYTVIPLVMIGVFFFYTQRDMTEIRSLDAEPDVTIQVVGKQWSWDINYLDDDVYFDGQHAKDVSVLGGDTSLDGQPGTDVSLPTLYLPVGEQVELVLDSRDVIHSFWVPSFYFKMDVIPGQENSFDVTPNRLGTYDGKCAELCGEYHALMLFKVHIVTEEEYEAYVRDLAESGNEGARLVQDTIQNALPSTETDEEHS